MSLHNKPEYNSPELVAALKAHGMATTSPSVVSDAFRLGWIASQPDWKAPRCEDCTCEYGGADCNDLKLPDGK